MVDDSFKHGLFEDSEDSATEDVIPSHLTTEEDPPFSDEPEPEPEPTSHEPSPSLTPITPEKIHKTILRTACPVKDHHLITCKLPPSVSMAASPFNEAEERKYLKDNPGLLEEPPSKENHPMIRWRFQPKSQGNVEPFGVLETNTHLVEWDDGTLTLYIGSTPLNVEYRKESILLLEDSSPEMKPVHAVIGERMQTMFANILRNRFSRTKEHDAKRQKMTVTSIADAMSSSISIQQRRLATRENERMRKVQQNNTYQPRGLTRQFLEGDEMR